MRSHFKSVLLSFSILIVGAAAAEEDPSYEPFNRVKPAAPPKRAFSLTETPSAPAPAKTQPVAPARVQPSPTVTAPSAPYSPPAPAASGPKVKYILNGKPVYEGDPDPVAEANARAKTQPAATVSAPSTQVRPSHPAPQTAPETSANNRVRLDSTTMAPPIRGQASVYAPSASQPVYSPPATISSAPAAPAGPKVKYILDGKPVYEGDPDPVGDAKISGATSAVPQAQPNTFTPAPPAGLIDDLTADRPAPGAPAARVQQSFPGQLVLEDFPAPGQVNSRAEKAYAVIAELKKNVEAVSRSLDNRGKENARLVHTSETILTNINDLAAVWPENQAFIDVCSTAKRAALVFNSEVSNVPWTWTRVRWSFDAMLRDVKTLRAYAKSQAEAEPRPQPVVSKEGTIVYIDAQEAPVDPLAAKREAASRAAREELARYKQNAAAREERKAKKLSTDLDGN